MGDDDVRGASPEHDGPKEAEYERFARMKRGEFKAILEDEGHPEHAGAAEYDRRIAEELAEFSGTLSKGSVLKAMKPFHDRMASVAEEQQRRWQGMREMSEAIQPLPDPTYDVLDEQREMNKLLAATNEHLSEMVDIARADADAARADADAARADAAVSRRQAKHGLAAAWTAVGVTVAVGLVQIVVAIVGA